MTLDKKYWKSIEELKENNSAIDSIKHNEFVEKIPVDDFFDDDKKLQNSSTTRRDFLKYMGFSTAVASMVACEGPVKKTIPYVVQPEQIRPGVADYYATTIADGFDFATVLVKTREGRPIRIIPNKTSNIRNYPNARVQASVLSLYDSKRLQFPISNLDEKVKVLKWNELDKNVIEQIKKSKASDKKVVLLTNTLASPSAYQLISNFSDNFKGVEHIEYDAISQSATLDAFEEKYGVRAMPDYDLEKVEMIVSFDADFLGDWQGGYQCGYAKNREPKKSGMSYHVQFESNMTLSGANADKRMPLSPPQIKEAFAKFYSILVNGNEGNENIELNAVVSKYLKKLATKIKALNGKAVVLCGIDDKDAQLLNLKINEIINSEAVDLNKPLLTQKGSDDKFEKLLDDMVSGNVGTLIVSGVNPFYTYYDTEKLEKAFSSVDFSVTISKKMDETAIKSNYVVSASHNLESWGDIEIKKGIYHLVQPTIRPLYKTRQFEECLLKWMSSSEDVYTYVKNHWNKDVLNEMNVSFEKALHDGIVETSRNVAFKENADISYQDSYKNLIAKNNVDGMQLVLYTKQSMGDGQQANNPWLQELPDPITRVAWDNYLTISQEDANKLNLENVHVANGAFNGSYVTVVTNGQSIKVPIIIQPGQAVGSVGLAFGYGDQRKGFKKEMKVGVNAYKLYKNSKKVHSVEIKKVDGEHEFACVQLHNTLMGRGDIIKETTLDKFISEGSEVWNPKPKVSLNHKEVPASSVTIWDNFDRTSGHHFNLSIDLNACTGCGACVIACNTENNVPVVGKQEVRNSRDMHWLRIDRYYSSENTFERDFHKKENISGVFGSMTEFSEMEKSAKNPQVAFQPVMCQHCNHAPCETVCPVAATSHGKQGQNQMAYNRCVGTRYCANNCPYKVRRFNWFSYTNNDEFDYHMNDDLGKMVLNPDVVVRSRGVMEKCSMCIQMTQKTILDAKRDGRELKGDAFETACSQVCSTGAMVFGDINDKDSKISELKSSERMYHLLEHVGTYPNVFYHVKVRNTKKEEV